MQYKEYREEVESFSGRPNKSFQPTPRRLPLINLKWWNRTLSLSARGG
jgi:hypothetical protein